MKPGKIISFSGAQSTGKSTLMNKLAKTLPESCFFIPEITRKLREQGFVINENGDDETQRAIINAHEDKMDVANVIATAQEPRNVIMDRCIWDGVIYTSWLHHEGRVDKKTVDYAYDTFDLLIGGYDIIFYTEPGDVPLVDDGERSANKEFRDQIIEMFENSIFEVSKHTEVVRLKGSVEKRMKTVLEYLK